MEKGVNLCDFGDILSHAERLGYGWNQAHAILDNYYPYHGEYYVCLAKVEQDENEDAKKILVSYFERHQIEDFYIKPKGG